MTDRAIEISLNEFGDLYKKSRHRFPYEGRRKLQRENKGYEGLVPDLDLYLKDIAGCCSRPLRLLRWSKTKRGEVQKKILTRSFFEKNPEYKPLESQITEENTPDLYAELALHDVMRARLLNLFSLLEQNDVQAP